MTILHFLWINCSSLEIYYKVIEFKINWMKTIFILLLINFVVLIWIFSEIRYKIRALKDLSDNYIIINWILFCRIPNLLCCHRINALHLSVFCATIITVILLEWGSWFFFTVNVKSQKSSWYWEIICNVIQRFHSFK